jgi:hypothetical protein
MATRMQQRRGTAAQWTAANPILAAGEIGFETDTSKFKMGNGSSTWSALTYFANATELAAAVDAVVGMAPETLDTLVELASAIGNDADFIGTVTAHTSDTTGVHGIADTAALATTAGVNSAIDVAAGVLTGQLTTVANNLSFHTSETTDVHGIDDVAALVLRPEIADFVTQTELTDAISGAAGDYPNLAGNGLDWNAANEQFDVDATIATLSYVDTAKQQAIATAAEDATEKANQATQTAADALGSHQLDTTEIHGIADTSLLATMSYADQAEADAILAAGSAADTKVSDHNLETTNVHGIADTAALATKAYADQAETDAITAAGSAADTKVADAVAALTKSSVGLANVDNTSDANKPVSTATQTALNLKANLAGATFTGDVTVETDLIVDGNLTVTGTTTTVSATDLVVSDPLIYIGEGNTANLVDLGLVSSYNDGTYQHAGIVRDSSAGKWKIFKGVTDEPTTTVNFAQGSLDALAVGALEATTVTASSGIVFSDGTQTKLGVPSVTTFATAISSSATLAAGEQDKFVPLTGAVTITLPATGYSTGQSIDFYQASGTGAAFASTNSVVGTPGLKFRTTNSVVTAMKTSSGWLVFGDLSA